MKHSFKVLLLIAALLVSFGDLSTPPSLEAADRTALPIPHAYIRTDATPIRCRSLPLL